MKSKLDRITEIQDLFKDRTISREEFDILKKEILQDGVSNSETIDEEGNRVYAVNNSEFINSEKPRYRTIKIITAILAIAIFISSLLKINSKNSNSPEINQSPTNSTQNDIKPDNTLQNDKTQTPETENIGTYVINHSFSYNGHGNITFSSGTVTVKGGEYTLLGHYHVVGSNTIIFNDMQAIEGNFDASNNPQCHGSFYLNKDGTLDETLSDGMNTKHYSLTAE